MEGGETMVHISIVFFYEKFTVDISIVHFIIGIVYYLIVLSFQRDKMTNVGAASLWLVARSQHTDQSKAH